jgi:hypothetical protein
MATFILTWNPTKWAWEEYGYQQDIETTESGEIVEGRWSVGGRKYGVDYGDEAFLFRQHDHRGIVASGVFASGLFEDEHWDGSGRPERYGDIYFDTILGPDDGLPVEVLKRRVPEVSWDRLQGSGVKVPDSAEASLHQLWEDHLAANGRSRPPGAEIGALLSAEVQVDGGIYVVVRHDVETYDCPHDVWYAPDEALGPRDNRNVLLGAGVPLPDVLRLIADRIEQPS